MGPRGGASPYKTLLSTPPPRGMPTFATLVISTFQFSVHSSVAHTCSVFFPSDNKFSQQAISQQKMRKLTVTLLRYAVTININFMADLEKKIQLCYHNNIFVTKDMRKKHFHRNCLQSNNLSWFAVNFKDLKLPPFQHGLVL